jgi:hypothetical protein
MVRFDAVTTALNTFLPFPSSFLSAYVSFSSPVSRNLPVLVFEVYTVNSLLLPLLIIREFTQRAHGTRAQQRPSHR